MQKQKNHIMPFLWIHGEDESVYRRLIRAIDEANCKAFCVEARPHNDFCGKTWWRDMDIILDEAERRGMKVWILDDKHFPTGYANGGALKAETRLRRQSLCSRIVRVRPGQIVKLDFEKYRRPKTKMSLFGYVMDKINQNGKIKFLDDALFSVTAVSSQGVTDLSPYISGGKLKWRVPQGVSEIVVCSLSRNVGIHRAYINMLEAESCKILLDEVYEPHYTHYREKFGTVIAGFFSDEPELGNSFFCNLNTQMGSNADQPWSGSLESKLKQRLGKDYKNLLALVFSDACDKTLAASVRYAYMDCVTRQVEACFSRQIGEWCRSRGVDYIGHVIEDYNMHARTGSSLGHYFRGIKYQSMAGVDIISDQVKPNGENGGKVRKLIGFNDFEFNHYALAKLASSFAAINPRMGGNAMCEIFGNYGWKEGVRLEKYLVDHAMVRGINNFVPHAFTCKDYPDKDCPPHFYAQGHNPQYRHFGALMQYTNRVCELISGGKADVRVAVLYHGEAEWTGECMLMQEPARVLYDNNVDFYFLPSDVFAEQEFYGTKIGEKLVVGNAAFSLLVVPYAEFITKETAEAIVQMQKNGMQTVFIDGYPKGACNGEPLPNEVKSAAVVSLAKLKDFVALQSLRQIIPAPQTNRLRCLHYLGKDPFYYLFNEGTDIFDGTVEIEEKGRTALYDAWKDEYTDAANENGKIRLQLPPLQSVFIFPGKTGEARVLPAVKTELKRFKRSVCRAIDYPHFTDEKEIERLVGYEKTDKRFSGIIRYETEIDLKIAAAPLLKSRTPTRGWSFSCAAIPVEFKSYRRSSLIYRNLSKVEKTKLRSKWRLRSNGNERAKAVNLRELRGKCFYTPRRGERYEYEFQTGQKMA